MTTILDVARYAGVSRTTVSRVLNNQPRVDEKTRKKVLAAIEELNYQPSRTARNLRHQKTYLIAVVIPCISNPFFGRLVQGMEEVAARKGYNVIICNTSEDLNRELDYLNMLRKKQIDGIILTALRNPLEKVSEYLQYGPIILACEYVDSNAIPAIVIDNRKASEDVTTHLIKKGHKRIAFINGPEQIVLCRDRLEGYIDTLKKYNITVLDDYVVSSDFSMEGGRESARKLLALKQKPTAIFAANDDMAIGVIQTLQEAGYQIPSDVAVAGFDNLDLSQVVRPRLTTIHQPILEIGIKAMKAMLRSIEGIQCNGKRTVLEASLCIREST